MITASPPCRSVMMVAKSLGVQLNLKPIDIYKQEHLTPEFLKINPQHTIPTLVDNGFAIWESRAILGYLVEKYGKNDSLFPKDAKKRAVVNQRLYFDMGNLYQHFYNYFIPIMRGSPADPEKFKKVEDSLEVFDKFLENTKYAAGDNLTIADYALVSTYSTILQSGMDFSGYKNVTRWYESRSSFPGIEINEEGVAAIQKMMIEMKSKAQA